MIRAESAKSLRENLRAIRRRLLAVRCLEAGLAGAIGAAELAAVVTLIRILMPQHVPATAAHPQLPLLLIPCGFVLGWLVRRVIGVSLRQAALVADRVAGLKERLATALEVLEAAPPDSGLLDDRLVEQAATAVAALDPRRLALARDLGRNAKVFLVAAVLLVSASLIPPVGGPAVAPQAAHRAAEALGPVAAQPSAMPAVRAAAEKAIGLLQSPGARQGAIDQATAGVYQAATKAQEARQASLEALQSVENPEIREMVRAAAAGDTSAADAAAHKAAERLAAAPESGGLTPADRTRVADGLTGAARVASHADLARLAAELDAAADAIRRGRAGAPELERLARAMTENLGETPGGVAGTLAAVAQTRRALGLPELPALVPGQEPAAGTPGPSSGGPGGPNHVRGQEAAVPPPAAEAKGAAGATVPADVRPEDRDVIRRYFGG
jgi:hypothetical protein